MKEKSSLTKKDQEIIHFASCILEYDDLHFDELCEERELEKLNKELDDLLENGETYEIKDIYNPPKPFLKEIEIDCKKDKLKHITKKLLENEKLIKKHAKKIGNEEQILEWYEKYKENPLPIPPVFIELKMMEICKQINKLIGYRNLEPDKNEQIR